MLKMNFASGDVDNGGRHFGIAYDSHQSHSSACTLDQRAIAAYSAQLLHPTMQRRKTEKTLVVASVVYTVGF